MEVDPKFNFEDFKKSQRVMKCARQLFPNPKDQESWALAAYEKWQSTGETPESIRDKRNPNWRKTLEIYEKRSKTKLLYYP